MMNHTQTISLLLQAQGYPIKGIEHGDAQTEDDAILLTDTVHVQLCGHGQYTLWQEEGENFVTWPMVRGLTKLGRLIDKEFPTLKQRSK